MRILPRDTLVVIVFTVSWTKISLEAFVSSATRLSACEENVTYSPLVEIDGVFHTLLAWTPLLSTDVLVVIPVTLSWTNISCHPFVSPVTRLLASDLKAI